MEQAKRTALYNAHLKLGGKMIDFAGWNLPVEYSGIIDEHEAVRNAAGVFDVSHMGEVEVNGREAFNFIQHIVTNDIKNLMNNQVIYTPMCYESGGVVDDLLVYKFNGEQYLLVINAANIGKDYGWIIKNSSGFDVCIENISDKISEIALQGPKAQETLQKLTDTNLSSIKFFFCKRHISISGIECTISRTGYTGEDGFEIYAPNENIEKVWNVVIEAGHEYGVKPAGLGARDTLRFEVALPLYGNEISKDITPLEAGLQYFVKLDKEDFIGREALLKQKEEGLKRKLVGFEMVDRGIPRHGYEVSADGKNIGFVTTGYFSPTLKKSIGLALVDIKFSEMGSIISVDIRGRAKKAKVVSKKFYNKKYKK